MFTGKLVRPADRLNEGQQGGAQSHPSQSLAGSPGHRLLVWMQPARRCCWPRGKIWLASPEDEQLSSEFRKCKRKSDCYQWIYLPEMRTKRKPWFVSQTEIESVSLS